MAAATTTTVVSCSRNVFPAASVSTTTHCSYQQSLGGRRRRSLEPANSHKTNKKLFAQLGLLQLRRRSSSSSRRNEPWQERRIMLWDSSHMRAMAEEESAHGGGSVATTTTTSDKLAAEEAEDQALVSEIFRVLDLLKKKRDMSFAEVKLTIMIEDPREVQRRKELDIEDGRGCSREDMANALVEINEGRMPADRLVLKELAKEMTAWPNLEGELQELNPAASPYAKVTPTGVDPKVAAQRARVDWDAAAEIQPGAEQKELSDMVPPAVGFSLLYVVSFIPIIIGVTVVLILFFNSLQ